MSLRLKIDASEESNSFIVYDCTGNQKYDNPGGWNAPNPEIKKITSSTLFITPPNIGPGVPPYSIDVTGSLPNTGDYGLEVLPYQIGQVNNQLLSGKYTIKLEVKGIGRNGVEYTTSTVIYKIFTKNVSCCIDKLQKTVNRDAYKDKKQEAAIDLNLMLMSVCWDVECGLLDQASEKIEFLKSQCLCIDC